MTKISQEVREHVTSLSDHALIAMTEIKSQDYTSEALAFANDEITKRGGSDILKEKIRQARLMQPKVDNQKQRLPEPSSELNGVLNLLKQYYWLLLFASYFLAMLLHGDSLWFFWLCVFAMIGFVISAIINRPAFLAEQEIQKQQQQQIICPHCQMRGSVTTNSVNRKKGISGAKATGALLTGGLSILATGLSRKETDTEAHCSNCGSTWYF